MNINIIDKDVESFVCVIINDQCNHFDSEVEDVSIDTVVDGDHWQYSKKIEVCQNCRAWRDEFNDCWEENL